MDHGSGSTSFAEAMALRGVGAGEAGPTYAAVLSEHWTIGPKLHGGVMVALCAAAARAAHGGEVQPVAVSATFRWAPRPGALELATAVTKRGRRIGVVEVELRQRDEHGAARSAVRAEVTLGAPDPGPPLLRAEPVSALMTPDPPPRVAAIGPGHPSYGVVNLAAGCDIRADTATWRRGADGTSPTLQTWARPRHGVTDALFALMCGDISAPVTYAVGRRGWAPTVQLTAYLRALPADGWLRVLCTTTQVGRDWFDADHTVVDSSGALVVQTRQLALVPPAVTGERSDGGRVTGERSDGERVTGERSDGVIERAAGRSGEA